MVATVAGHCTLSMAFDVSQFPTAGPIVVSPADENLRLWSFSRQPKFSRGQCGHLATTGRMLHPSVGLSGAPQQEAGTAEEAHPRHSFLYPPRAPAGVVSSSFLSWCPQVQLLVLCPAQGQSSGQQGSSAPMVTGEDSRDSVESILPPRRQVRHATHFLPQVFWLCGWAWLQASAGKQLV